MHPCAGPYGRRVTVTVYRHTDMRIKFYFLFLALLLAGLVVTLLLGWGSTSRYWFFLVEGGLLFLLLFLVVFYHRLVKPLVTIGNGMELLREQDFSSRLSPVGQVEADRIVDIFNRMMHQLKDERLRLREQNQFLDLLIQASPMGVLITDQNYRVTQVNPMAMRLLDLRPESVVGRLLADVPSSLAVELSRLSPDETRVVRFGDANVYKCIHGAFLDRGFRHPFFLVERMTEEVARAERKAYEKVIRMIAHEVNNTMAGITSALDIVEHTLKEEEGMGEMCEVTRVCTERCYSLSQFITRFADVVKIPEPMLQSVSLNGQVAVCFRFMEGACTFRGIGLRMECDPSVGLVRLDAALFEQVLVNIVKNSMESIGGGPGSIVLRTVAPSTVVVEDDGPGISTSVEEKLFTPFFSTKPKGQGIGLVFIREVLMRHGCRFSLHTDSDGWTRFAITFPLPTGDV